MKKKKKGKTTEREKEKDEAAVEKEKPKKRKIKKQSGGESWMYKLSCVGRYIEKASFLTPPACIYNQALFPFNSPR